MSANPVEMQSVVLQSVELHAWSVVQATVLTASALFAVSFLVSGTETAMFSLQKVDRQDLAAQGRTGALLTRLLSARRRLLQTLNLGNELAGLTLTCTTAAALYALAPNLMWVNVVLLTPLLVLGSEITPKVLAFRLNRSWSMLAAWPVGVLAVAVSPFRAFITSIETRVALAFDAEVLNDDEGLEESNLRQLVNQGAAEGTVDPKERDLIEAVFAFDDLTVDRLMTPRPDMFAIALETPWSELLAVCRDATYSRIPVYHRKSDEIVGVLLLKDLLRHRNAPPVGPRQLRSLLLPPTFVPASKPADAMLRNFLERKFHMAFVVDEHGTIIGVITLDDLLDALVGDSLTEETTNDIARVDPTRLRVNAGMDLEDFTQETEIEIPEGDYNTLGGFVFHRLGRLPRLGDAITHDDRVYAVTAMEGRRIAELEITSAPDADSQAAVG